MGYIRLFIENKVENIPIECKLICKDFFGGLIDTKILTMNEECLLLNFVNHHLYQMDMAFFVTIIFVQFVHVI